MAILIMYVNHPDTGVVSFNPAFAGQQILLESLFIIAQGDHVSFLPR